MAGPLWTRSRSGTGTPLPGSGGERPGRAGRSRGRALSCRASPCRPTEPRSWGCFPRCAWPPLCCRFALAPSWRSPAASLPLTQPSSSTSWTPSPRASPRHGAEPTAQFPAGLTTPEAEVLTLIAQGLSNSEIASRLMVSETTIKSHINHLFAKTGVRDRAQAVHLRLPARAHIRPQQTSAADDEPERHSASRRRIDRPAAVDPPTVRGHEKSHWWPVPEKLGR